MNSQILETLIHEGYSGIDIAEFEICEHSFTQVLVADFSKDEFIVDIECEKCGCDAHAANLMGLDPLYYNDIDDFV